MSNVRMMKHQVHKFGWYVKPKHDTTRDVIGLDWKTKTIGSDGCKRKCIGPLVNFVAKDNANYQFAELPMNMNT
jgi:hypothetical protein